MTEHLINVLRMILGNESFEDAAKVASELVKLSAINADTMSTTLEEMYSKLLLLELKTLREILVSGLDEAIEAASKPTTKEIEISDNEIRIVGE